MTINLAMIVEYDGTNFYGFQKQNNGRTIQHEIERAIKQFINMEVTIFTAGRTDSGVHAKYQVINFHTTVNRELYSWRKALNSFLPLDIAITQVVQVPNDFHARFSASMRTYHYYLVLDPVRPVILRNKIGWYYATLNIELMRQACALLIGTHDFSSFRASQCQAKTPIRTVTQAELVLKDNLLRFEITANAFLYNMIRIIMGCLLAVGKGKLTLLEFTQLIQARNRSMAPATFMPDGLYLVSVQYSEPYFQTPTLKWLF